ncbi:MAG: GntR family transcriptional regulator [Oscillospiraceae bacterium]|nr:GntR family transcriptional regulator [Oscillospiraceae bacterium]
MNIIISNGSNDPIYTQIEQQIKAAIVSGQLKQGDMLPSMRVLAKELHISIITTKRAYEELERGGFIQTVAGKGCFVAPKNLEFVREMHLQELEDALAKAAELAKMCNIPDREVHTMLDMFLKGDLYE